MKYILAIIIFCVMLIIAIAISGCGKWCDPNAIESGKSLQHHDTKKFRATYSRHGNLWVVTYKNMQEERKQIVLCQPPFRNGSWVFIMPCCKN